MKILTDTYIDNRPDIHILYFIFYIIHIFVTFTRRIVSDAHDIRLVNEYVCMHIASVTA